MNEAREKAFNGALLLHGADYDTVILDEDDCRKIVEAVLAVKPEPVFEWREMKTSKGTLISASCWVNGECLAVVYKGGLRRKRQYSARHYMLDRQTLHYDAEADARLAVESAFREWLNGIY